MSTNPIQFQRGLSLPDFLSQYGTEAQCESALEKVRWRDGFRCPQCGHDHCTVFRRGQQRLYQCSGCHHQTSLRVDTLFLAIYLITQAKNGVSALELMRSPGDLLAGGLASQAQAPPGHAGTGSGQGPERPGGGR